MSEPVFVSKDWVEKVDAELKNDAPPQPVAPPPSSRFYDVRPVSIQSDWTRNDAGVWSADAAFIINDTVDTSFIFPVYAPHLLGEKPKTPRPIMFAVWRGRWEIIPRDKPTLTTTTTNVVASISPMGSDKFLLGTQLNGQFVPDYIANVTLTSYDQPSGVPDDGGVTIPYVASFEQVMSTWQPVYKYLHLAIQKQPFRYADAITGTGLSVEYTNVIESASVQ